MSGPLRRTKRSRPADAGEPLPEGRAAETEGAAPTAETPPAAPETAGDAAVHAESPTPEPEQERAVRPDPDDTPAATEPARVEEAAPTPPVENAAPADQPTAPVQEVSPTGTATPAGTGASATEPSAPETPAGDTSPDGSADAAGEPEPRTAKRRSRWRPFGRAPKTAPPVTEPTTPAAPAPVLLADPDTPAGVDPAEAPMRPPAGRRGRLRRRLRYLRRARELMLRDLGGLLYEVHRSGGGSVDAHATVVGAKVQRIGGLDAEMHALETALAAPRGETIVFEPGVGGTCATCGELYSSDAHFCANCGAAVGTGAPLPRAAEAQPPVVAGDRARRAFWRRAARPAEPAPADTAAPDSGAAAVDDTAVAAPAPRAGVGGDEPTAIIPPAETATPAADDAAATTPDETSGPAEDAAPKPPDDATPAPADEAPDDAAPPTTDEAAQEKPAPKRRSKRSGDDPPAAQAAESPGDQAPSQPGGEPQNPFPGVRNGRPEDHTPPELSSGDPLVRDSRK